MSAYFYEGLHMMKMSGWLTSFDDFLKLNESYGLISEI